MKLSQLLEISKDNLEEVYRLIDVDVESFSPPPGIKTAGLLVRMEDDELDMLVMDVGISYGLAGVDVILEVPFDLKIEGLDAKYLMGMAANAGFSISVLPPAEDTDENREIYKKSLGCFAGAYLGQSNFNGFVYPVSSFLEYLHSECITDVSDYKATDPYMIEAFVDCTTKDFSDDFKVSLREDIYEAFGGKDGFESYSNEVMSQIYAITEANVKDVSEQMLSEASAEIEAGEADADATDATDVVGKDEGKVAGDAEEKAERD